MHALERKTIAPGHRISAARRVGAAGCAVAYYLAQSGVSSTIIEREGIGNQASGNAAGGLNPDFAV